jgi:hypothetical protein
MTGVITIREGEMSSNHQRMALKAARLQTVFVLTPISDGAKVWIKESVHYESYQKQGDGVVVEHRYIADIAAGLIEVGFIPNKDFRVC